MSIYISTSCLKDGENIFTVLDSYNEFRIENIELGATHQYANQKRLIQYINSFHHNLTVHNYFPPPKNELIINLASQNKNTLKKSLNFIKRSIRFCTKINVKLYSLHGGFILDPDSNFKFKNNLKADSYSTSYQNAFDTFLKSVKEVNEYAEKRRIKIAIENNTLSESTITSYKSPLVLMCRTEEFNQLFKYVQSDNLGILLDLGHLKTTSYWIGIDKNKFIRGIEGKVFEIHVSENNGKRDEHKKLTEDSWCLKRLHRFKNTPITLESTNLCMDDILYNKRLLQMAINSD